MSAVITPTRAPADQPRRRGNPWLRVGMLLLIAGFAAFWTWALFFASKEAVNKIDDRAWAERAEQICAEATTAREALADYTRIDDEPTAALIAQRAGIVDASTDILERMIDDLIAVAPSDPKGADIVPLWVSDYRALIADRRDYAEQLRRSGENLAFYETGVGGIPVGEKLTTFAGDNEMPSCAPPTDLSA